MLLQAQTGFEILLRGDKCIAEVHGLGPEDGGRA
jgi:hypothetical protein